SYIKPIILVDVGGLEFRLRLTSWWATNCQLI
ncbi:MAG: hypothetical protein ACI957_003762, partial [Verrucomicrobiales bacterium]